MVCFEEKSDSQEEKQAGHFEDAEAFVSDEFYVISNQYPAIIHKIWMAKLTLLLYKLTCFHYFLILNFDIEFVKIQIYLC